MKIISWNVNSVRARIENIKDYIKDTNPDVLLLQEIKTQNENFPNDEFKKLGYISYVFGQKSYNGVAIISKHELNNINNSFIKDDLKQSRVITAELKLKRKMIEIINIYVPNGNPIETKKSSAFLTVSTKGPFEFLPKLKKPCSKFSYPYNIHSFPNSFILFVKARADEYGTVLSATP